MSDASAKSIFLAAIESHPEDQWPAFLEDACGHDVALRAAVERLLRGHRQLGDFNESVRTEASVSSAITFLGEIRVGAQVGAYTIREKLAEGGMGIVYVAEQLDPVQRRVALKVIRPGFSASQIVSRFEAERQALALMDHPNIARVLDGGATETGQPYFVMELVEGLPLTEYCDEKRLATRDRLKLFVKVCRAVQHAHQKGIIHRDIKPSNVLVAEVDGEHSPRVIDFGIAKAVDRKLSESTVCTHFSEVMGTPAYMSPEQVGLWGADVDTRSDVYSLGVMLYELLTGVRPFGTEQLERLTFDGLRRVIGEQDPVRPSRRVGTTRAEQISTVVECRRTDVRKLTSQLRGDMDWVVMKALSKDRELRYASPAEFAEDLERFLSYLPVLAGPPSLVYRAGKYVRRHRLPLAAAAVVALSMIAGSVISVGYAIKAQRARQDAETAEDLAGRRLILLQREQTALKAEQQKLRDEKHRLIAEQTRSRRHFELAKASVAELVDEVGAERLKALPGFASVREDLLVRADNFYSELLREDSADVELLLRRGAVRQRLSRLGEALRDYRVALNLEPENPRVHITLAYMYRHPSHGAVRDPDQALYHARRAVCLAPNNPDAWFELAWVYQNSFGECQTAARAMRRAADMQPSKLEKEACLGQALSFESRWEEAVEMYSNAILEGPAFESTINLSRARGVAFLQLGRFDEAVADFSQALRRDAFKSLPYEHRAFAYFRQKKYQLALNDWRQALRISPHLMHEVGSPVFFQPCYALECCLQLHDWEAAKEFLKEQRGDLPIDLGIFSSRCSELVEASRDAELIEAHRALFQRLEVTLQNPERINSLAWLLATLPQANLRDPSRAVSLMSPILDGVNGALASRYWNTYGVALYHAGELRRAIEALETSEWYSTSERCSRINNYYLAVSHWQLGCKEIARDYLASAEEQGSESDDVLQRFYNEAKRLIRDVPDKM